MGAQRQEQLRRLHFLSRTMAQIEMVRRLGEECEDHEGWEYLNIVSKELTRKLLRMKIDPYAWLTQCCADVFSCAGAEAIYGLVRSGNLAERPHKRVGAFTLPLRFEQDGHSYRLMALYPDMPVSWENL